MKVQADWMENISLQCIYTLYVQICTVLYSLRNTEMQLSIHPCWYCILLTHFSHQCKDNQNFRSVSRFFFLASKISLLVLFGAHVSGLLTSQNVWSLSL